LDNVAEVRSADESTGAACPDTRNSTRQFTTHQISGDLFSLVPTPTGLAHAFREAVQAVDALHRGKPEAVLLYRGEPVSIRYMIEAASIFHEQMPDDLFERLCELAVSGEEPKARTFDAGAQCLRRIYSDLRARRRGAVGTTRKRRHAGPLSYIATTRRLACGLCSMYRCVSAREA
jgi:hypothetical protein